MKLFMFFINSIFWAWLFIIPTGLLSFFGLWLYLNDESNLPWLIFLSVIGIVLGIIIAEKVRKRYGLSRFFSRLSSSDDVIDNSVKGDR